MKTKIKKIFWIIAVIFIFFLFTNYLDVFWINELFVKKIFGDISYRILFLWWARYLLFFMLTWYVFCLFYFKKYRQYFIYGFFPLYIILALVLKYGFGYYDGFLLSNLFCFSFCYLMFLLYFYHDYDNSLTLYSNKNALKTQFEDSYNFEDITVMFIDIQNYTKISEKLKSCELIWLFLNLYIGYIEKIIIKHNGIVDKIMWDGIMLLFRWNNKEKDAVLCALKLAKIRDSFLDYIENDVMKWFKKWNISQKNLNYWIILDILKQIEFNIRIWIATWKVFLWVVWWKKIKELTIIWDHVNLASRLETTNKLYRTDILCDENTIKWLDNNFVFRMVDKIKVKWKDEVKAVFQPIYHKKEEIWISNMSTENITSRHNILKSYFQKDFKNALELVEKYLKTNENDKVAKIFYNRLHALNNRMVSVSFEWDGTRENSIFCE